MPKLNAETLHLITQRGVAEIIVEADFVRRLESGRPLRLKMGFDPSAPDIHFGHAVGLRKLRQLQELGHQVVVIVGDWTARIGDPSGRSSTRPMLSPDQVEANAQTYLDPINFRMGGVGGDITLAGAVVTSNLALSFTAGTGDGGIFTQSTGAGTLATGSGAITITTDAIALDEANANTITTSTTVTISTATAGRISTSPTTTAPRSCS